MKWRFSVCFIDGVSSTTNWYVRQLPTIVIIFIVTYIYFCQQFLFTLKGRFPAEARGMKGPTPTKFLYNILSPTVFGKDSVPNQDSCHVAVGPHFK